jgi:Skp family chaperone for outer membrane proteins
LKTATIRVILRGNNDTHRKTTAMMTGKFTNFSLLLISLIALTACNQEPAKPQAVVMNMLEVTAAVNMPERLKAFSDAESEKIKSEMKGLGDKYMKEIADKEASFGDDPSQEQQDELKRMRARLQKQYSRASMTANTQKNKEKNALRQSILDEITPTAQQVAAEHGATIIIKDDSVFWSESSLDITSEVISRLPAEETSNPAAPAEEAKTAEDTVATEDAEADEVTEATDGE